MGCTVLAALMSIFPFHGHVEEDWKRQAEQAQMSDEPTCCCDPAAAFTWFFLYRGSNSQSLLAGQVPVLLSYIPRPPRTSLVTPVERFHQVMGL